MSSLSGSRLMGLCTIAVGAIYAAGYLYTEPSITNARGTPPAIATTQSPRGSAKSKTPSSKAGSSAAGQKPSATGASAHTMYKDGVYTGAGANPYGTLTVAVSISHGKILSVKITSYNMHYPQSIIDPQLPQEAVSKQTWRIYIVSGATASTYNFAEAVYYALQKAKV